MLEIADEGNRFLGEAVRPQRVRLQVAKRVGNYRYLRCSVRDDEGDWKRESEELEAVNSLVVRMYR